MSLACSGERVVPRLERMAVSCLTRVAASVPAGCGSGLVSPGLVSVGGAPPPGGGASRIGQHLDAAPGRRPEIAGSGKPDPAALGGGPPRVGGVVITEPGGLAGNQDLGQAGAKPCVGLGDEPAELGAEGEPAAEDLEELDARDAPDGETYGVARELRLAPGARMELLVQGHQHVAEPVPWAGRSGGKGGRKLTWDKQKFA